MSDISLLIVLHGRHLAALGAGIVTVEIAAKDDAALFDQGFARANSDDHP